MREPVVRVAVVQGNRDEVALADSPQCLHPPGVERRCAAVQVMVVEQDRDLDDAVLHPRSLYESQGRASEYTSLVAALQEERAAHLSGYADLLPEIAGAV